MTTQNSDTLHAKVVINADLGKDTINRNIYGHFSEHLGRCIYDGYWVGQTSSIPNTRGIRKDIVAALKAIKTPVLRWPGGCFADEYHWMDGIGPAADRPCMVNTHWGGVTENNAFGTHEFMDLCDQLECEPYICGNLGSGTVREMQQWVEYLTFGGISPMADLRKKNGRSDPWKVKFWGVGNENWGCGGRMRPEYYADEYRRYATYLRNFGENWLYKIACGSYNDNYHWTEVLMREARDIMDGLSYHYYCGSGKNSRSATEFAEIDWFELLKNALRLDEFVTHHAAIMDTHDPQKKVALIVDEWGSWHAVEPGTNPGFLYQQNTLRDALVASVSLDILNHHCDRVKMANIAQTINVLQAMVLTEGEKMLLTPTYHVFEMYTPHHDAVLLPMELQGERYIFEGESIPAFSGTASRDKQGKVHLTLSNLDPLHSATVACTVRGLDVSSASGRILTAETMNAHNTFNQPDTVHPVAFGGATLKQGVLSIELPAKSVIGLELV
jgi:alpha-L-arabinofuranosidase